MVSSEVQRTLVKSLPELWAELSDPAALSRHLGELGEIRITRVDPEQTVEWEASGIRGTVRVKPSGWGTRVTLTVDHQPGEPPAVEPEGETPEQPPNESRPGTVEGVPPVVSWPAATVAGAAPVPSRPDAEVEDGAPLDGWPEPALGDESSGLTPDGEAFERELDEPEPRPGFFARLFRRRRGAQAIGHEHPGAIADAAEPEIAEEHPSWKGLEPAASPPSSEGPEPAASPPASEAPEPAASPPVCETHDESLGPTDSPIPPEETIEAREDPEREPPVSGDQEPLDISAELRAAEEVTAEQVTAVLTTVLDRLGAAHHRPFSRG